MPIIEILLFGVGVAVGGRRALQKFRGEDGEETTAMSAPVSPCASPRQQHDRQRDRSDFQNLIDDARDTLALLSPRLVDNSSYPPRHDWDASDAGSAGGAGQLEGEDSIDRNWSSWISRIVGNNDSSHSVDAFGQANNWSIRDGIINLAGDNKVHAHKQEALEDRKSWDPCRTPRSSALRKGWDSPSPSPRALPQLPGRHVRFHPKPKLEEVHKIEHSPEELSSRRNHWNRILKAAERDAYDAYLSSGKHRRKTEADRLTSPSEIHVLYQDLLPQPVSSSTRERPDLASSCPAGGEEKQNGKDTSPADKWKKAAGNRATVPIPKLNLDKVRVQEDEEELGRRRLRR
ncbi:hypothetical protein GUITHDRAFT_108153 [Guillardia theta CCMP2712]|uniref:Uncharacterized protein n=2 Tax=Guillardia theta TaxID=55529 RepID=L1JDC1_GUITC|nr:hypothetical protein GUITHDRAFT_108153 [Guillardia theta CCMP2712]EKX46119.1 hypothetical protein GUITHDRAFT_108153 [Guillardia theta CCMP2712]|mmetsp:Transcript_32410/g.102852  ORF Transcript_32410/g.102852 Transcript_32410/m.102852 type:complete len:346 (+) Transcript_32410:196-1233(+)|eukprot:XP_005833099.1 hypothetical protein GUITHDRAFT_108153 [Guillardia theta CCMP2712]